MRGKLLLVSLLSLPTVVANAQGDAAAAEPADAAVVEPTDATASETPVVAPAVEEVKETPMPEAGGEEILAGDAAPVAPATETPAPTTPPSEDGAYPINPDQEFIDDGWKKPMWGGFGFASLGVSVLQVTRLGNTLEKPGMLGEGGSPSIYGWQLGGGGRLAIWKVLIGGKGYVNLMYDSNTPNGAARTFIGGGGLDVAYTVIDDDRVMVYPFVGFGGLGIDIEVRNGTNEERSFGDNVIPVNTKEDFTAGVFYVEFGFGGQLFFHPGWGGFNVGLELGVLTSIGSTTWSDVDDVDVGGVDRPGLLGGYIKLTVGGGGWYPFDDE